MVFLIGLALKAAHEKRLAAQIPEQRTADTPRAIDPGTSAAHEQIGLDAVTVGIGVP